MQDQYIVNNTQFWLGVSVLPHYLQVSIYYLEAHIMCTYIIGSHSVYIKSYQFIHHVNTMGSHNVCKHRMYSHTVNTGPKNIW